MSEYIRDDQERRAREEARRSDRYYDDRDLRTREVPQRSPTERLADVVNDPAIKIDAAMMKSINDPQQVMTSNGEVARITRRTGLGTGQFAGQFNRGMGFDLPWSNQRSDRVRRTQNSQRLSRKPMPWPVRKTAN